MKNKRKREELKFFFWRAAGNKSGSFDWSLWEFTRPLLCFGLERKRYWVRGLCGGYDYRKNQNCLYEHR